MSDPDLQFPRRVMILAAGEGTRLRPLTLETPKALLPLGGVPLIDHMLIWFRNHGISEVAINLHYLGNKVRDHLGDGNHLGMTVHYSEEEELLGTAGGVKRMERFFDGTFVVLYGDTLTDFDLSAMIEFHREKKSVATLAIFESPNPAEVGVVEMDHEGRIWSLVEKPLSPISDRQPPVLANGGVYLLEKEVLEYVPGSGFCDFARDTFPRLIEAGLPIYGFQLKSQDYFIDIGSPAKYQQADRDVQSSRGRIR